MLRNWVGHIVRRSKERLVKFVYEILENGALRGCPKPLWLNMIGCFDFEEKEG